jgi:hypothetical protein
MTRNVDNEYNIELMFRLPPNLTTDQLGEIIQKTRGILESRHLKVADVCSKLEYHTYSHYIPYIVANFRTDNEEHNTSMCETLLMLHDVIEELQTYRQFRTTKIIIKYLD